MNGKPDLAGARRAMVERQLRRRGICDERVLRAMSEVRREMFVGPDLAERAYDDGPLPIDAGQTISQPYIVAAMLQAAAIRPTDRVLDVGTGSGYAAAVLGRLADEVYTIERHRPLFESARRRLSDIEGPGRVHLRLGDGAKGWPEAEPFDAILVAAAAAFVLPSLRRQLILGGRLVAPVGGGAVQRLVKVTRMTEDDDREETLASVSFVPLVTGEAP